MAGTTRKAGGGFREADADGGWIEHRGDAYRYEVYLTPAGDRYDVVPATVPGVSATGATEAEALDAVRDALADLIRTKKAAGQPIPKADTTPPPGALSRWVIVRLGP